MHYPNYPRTALFWTQKPDIIPGMCQSRSPNLGVTALSVSITFTFSVFYRSSLSLFPFSSFFCSFFLKLILLHLSHGILSLFFHYYSMHAQLHIITCNITLHYIFLHSHKFNKLHTQNSAAMDKKGRVSTFQDILHVCALASTSALRDFQD